MKTHILFLQGGGGKSDHEVDAKLVDALQEAIGELYKVHYPLLENESSPDFGRLKQIEKEISEIDTSLILVGHSLGASMVLKFLSEHKNQLRIKGIFLLATPFWSGNEDWVQGLKLKSNFENELPKDVPIFFYHCHDDEEIPFSNLDHYLKKIPWATFREISNGGHQFRGASALIAKDIKSI
ncbi:MAG TPA: alpha/beta fold hydrolase [Ohtaekwangia sp.]|nr:alpha/beta fold hydrolase [Ohtaekwangia sp.]